ncbi:SURF1-like protein [Nakamurella endophytica]|uniref:SURF1-like protein n=1 Tax=Nakamurella endophytica TaxID=1748367 RepID=A0A917WJS0_9ACTN|nr:SURF1-like protein [Nakamurella endophytica]
MLAPWQFGRHAERSQRNATINAALTAPPAPVDEYLSVQGPPDPGLAWRQVTATGTFDLDQQVVVRLRQDQRNQPASEVLVPFRLQDGTTLVVDRGYIGLDAVDIPPAPGGRVTITGRIQPDQPDPLRRPPTKIGSQMLVTGIDSRQLQPRQAGDGTLRIGFVQLGQASPGALREIGVPQTDDGSYLSYALQWCTFGAIAVLTIAYFAWREAFDPRESDKRDACSSPPDQPSLRESSNVQRPTSVGTGVETGQRDQRSSPGHMRRRFDRSQLYDQDAPRTS